MDPVETEEITEELEIEAKPGEETGEAEETEVEEWQREDDSDDVSEGETVPAQTHIIMKQKWRGKVSKRDEEIERLKAENEALRTQKPIVSREATAPIMPKRLDFDDDDSYFAAMDDYQEKMTDVRLKRHSFQQEQGSRIEEHKRQIEKGINEHYGRVDTLVKTKGISEEVYKKADETVRAAIESVRPGEGDAIYDDLFSGVGEGSEKAVFYLGKNKAALNELVLKLQRKRRGIRAGMYIARLAERFNKSGARTSAAPEPGPTVKGDGAIESANSKKLKKAYDKAHNSKETGSAQKAWDIRSKAKKAGIDTRGW